MAWGGRSTSPEGGRAPEFGLGPGLRQRQRIRGLVDWVGWAETTDLEMGEMMGMETGGLWK